MNGLPALLVKVGWGRKSVLDHRQHVCHVGPRCQRNVVVVTPFELASGQFVTHLGADWQGTVADLLFQEIAEQPVS